VVISFFEAVRKSARFDGEGTGTKREGIIPYPESAVMTELQGNQFKWA
jgi:hypothetical protein